MLSRRWRHPVRGCTRRRSAHRMAAYSSRADGDRRRDASKEHRRCSRTRARFLGARGEGGPGAGGCARDGPEPEPADDGVGEERIRGRPRQHGHDKGEVARPLGAGERVQVADIAGWPGHGARPGAVVRHGAAPSWCAVSWNGRRSARREVRPARRAEPIAVWFSPPPPPTAASGPVAGAPARPADRRAPAGRPPPRALPS